jgi:ABC-2 type transport system ATP-binding protein
VIPALELQHVSVRYGAAPALTDVTFQVPPGAIVGLLGPNGAGKTTLLRVMLGFLRPDPHPDASVRVLGTAVAAADFLTLRRRIGFVPDPDGLDPRLSAERQLDQLAALTAAPALDRAAVCAALDLRPSDLRRRIGALSRGTRQKVALVQGLQHRPDLIILDEPGEGLDPLAQAGLLRLLTAARERGATVVFSSHVLSDVERICDQVALIRAGRLLASTSLAALRGRFARQVVLELREDAALPELAQARELRQLGAEWHFGWAGEIAPLLAALASVPIVELSIRPPTLADVFAALYGANADG